MPQTWDTVLRRLGVVLHDRHDELPNEALPQRWVDLLLYLDEQERKQSESRSTNQGDTTRDHSGRPDLGHNNTRRH